MLNSKLFGTKLFRVLFYLPSLTSAVAAAFVWQWLMNPAYGLLNSMLNGVGLPDCPWLTDKSTALFSIVLINLWGAIGVSLVIVALVVFVPPLQGFFNLTNLTWQEWLVSIALSLFPLLAVEVYKLVGRIVVRQKHRAALRRALHKQA